MKLYVRGVEFCLNTRREVLKWIEYRTLPLEFSSTLQTPAKAAFPSRTGDIPDVQSEHLSASAQTWQVGISSSLPSLTLTTNWMWTNSWKLSSCASHHTFPCVTDLTESDFSWTNTTRRSLPSNLTGQTPAPLPGLTTGLTLIWPTPKSHHAVAAPCWWLLTREAHRHAPAAPANIHWK